MTYANDVDYALCSMVFAVIRSGLVLDRKQVSCRNPPKVLLWTLGFSGLASRDANR